jgi:hypothetical protein
MTSPPIGAPFRFDTSYNPRDVRSNLNASGRSRRVTENQLLVIFGLMGIACLFWRYTIALGAVTLGLMSFVWIMQKRSAARRKQYEHLQMPSQVIHVTLTESGYSAKGDDFFAEAKWSNVFNALETNGFLLVQSWQGPRMYIPIDELQRAGLYERVRAIVDAWSPMPKRP